MRLLSNPVLLRTAIHGMTALLQLPEPVLRLIGGPAIVCDGQRMAPSAQVYLRLLRLLPPFAPPRTTDLATFRREMDQVAAAIGAGVSTDVRAQDTLLPRGDGVLARARLYERHGLAPRGPLLVYYHGGGFVFGSLDSHDAICRFLADNAHIRVLSVEYRLAPEHPFPAAVDDALASFRYVVRHARRFNTESGLVAVGGDSAGAGLAAVVAHLSTLMGSIRPALSVLLYPAVDVGGAQRSHSLFGSGYLLDRDTLDWYRDQYLPAEAGRTDVRLTVLQQLPRSGFPQTLVFTAGFDPLRDEGASYARRLRQAGALRCHRTFSGLLHGFANLVGSDPAARRAMMAVAEELRAAMSGLIADRACGIAVSQA